MSLKCSYVISFQAGRYNHNTHVCMCFTHYPVQLIIRQDDNDLYDDEIGMVAWNLFHHVEMMSFLYEKYNEAYFH